MGLDELALSAQRAVDRLIRRLRRGAPPTPTHRRLLVVQIDGLSRVALASGSVPFSPRLKRHDSGILHGGGAGCAVAGGADDSPSQSRRRASPGPRAPACQCAELVGGWSGIRRGPDRLEAAVPHQAFVVAAWASWIGPQLGVGRRLPMRSLAISCAELRDALLALWRRCADLHAGRRRGASFSTPRHRCSRSTPAIDRVPELVYEHFMQYQSGHAASG